MNYKALGNKKSVPQRMARKRMRRDVFVYNRKAKKLLKKSLRKQRKDLENV